MAATEAGGCRSSPFTTTLPGCPASTNEESWTDSEVDSSCSGQPIHLWQFLKELLLKPHSYGRFIRWLNKEKGKLTPVEGGQVPSHSGPQGKRGVREASGGPPGLLPGTGRGWGWAEGCYCPPLLSEEQVRHYHRTHPRSESNLYPCLARLCLVKDPNSHTVPVTQ